MPRHARRHTPGSPHHLISRFVNREWRLIGALERQRYLEMVPRARQVTDVRVSAYALMSSHIHWALCALEAQLGPFLRPLNTSFALWWNRTRNGFGPVFGDRPTSVVIDGAEQLARLVAYIHNNPVRAGVVREPQESNWTSHRAYIGMEPAPPWLDVEWTLAAMGFSARPSGRLAFHDFVVSRAPLPRDPQLAGPGPVAPGAARAVLRAVAAVVELDECDVFQSVPARAAIPARALFLHVGRDVFGVPAARLAADLGISPAVLSAVSRRLRTEGRPDHAVVRTVVEQYLANDARVNQVR